MNASLDRRLEAMENRLSQQDRVSIIRIVFLSKLPTEQDTEPFRADVGGRSIQREDDETGEAFLARVGVEARLAAKPGFVSVALVWPRTEGSEQADGSNAAGQEPSR